MKAIRLQEAAIALGFAVALSATGAFAQDNPLPDGFETEPVLCNRGPSHPR